MKIKELIFGETYDLISDSQLITGIFLRKKFFRQGLFLITTTRNEIKYKDSNDKYHGINGEKEIVRREEVISVKEPNILTMARDKKVIK